MLCLKIKIHMERRKKNNIKYHTQHKFHTAFFLSTTVKLISVKEIGENKYEMRHSLWKFKKD